MQKNLIQALSKVDLTISTSMYNDETACKMDYVCPENHNLESWGDLNPSHNVYSLMQPTIAPLFNTRQFEETILRWVDDKMIIILICLIFGEQRALIGSRQFMMDFLIISNLHLKLKQFQS